MRYVDLSREHSAELGLVGERLINNLHVHVTMIDLTPPEIKVHVTGFLPNGRVEFVAWNLTGERLACAGDVVEVMSRRAPATWMTEAELRRCAELALLGFARGLGP